MNEWLEGWDDKQIIQVVASAVVGAVLTKVIGWVKRMFTHNPEMSKLARDLIWKIENLNEWEPRIYTLEMIKDSIFLSIPRTDIVICGERLDFKCRRTDKNGGQSPWEFTKVERKAIMKAADKRARMLEEEKKMKSRTEAYGLANQLLSLPS